MAVTLVFYLLFVLAVLLWGELLFGTLVNVIRELPSLYTNQIEPLIQELIIRLEKATAAWDIDILS